MPPTDVSRRQFVLGSTAALFAARIHAQSAGLTAQQVADRIRTNAGAPPRANTVDGIKAGDPSMPVTGIATTVVVTLDLLRKAAAARKNFIVTHEPTFYGANDDPGAARASDPVYLAKKKLIEDQKLVVYRLFDQWNARQPNEAATALAATLGWTSSPAGAEPIYDVPEATLGELTSLVRSKLGVRGGIRVVGSSSTRVRRVFLSLGTTTLPATMAGLRQADVVIAGEPREWEAVPYTFDTAAAGAPKGMIALGRVVSEGPGMRACAAWLGKLVPEVPVEAYATVDPYWSPAS